MKLSRTSPGFSLVEIALAIGVISFCLIGLLGLVASTQTVVRTGIDRTDNSLLFGKVVNQLKVKPFDKQQVATTNYPSVLPLPSLKSGVQDPPFLVNDKYEYVGSVDSPEAIAKASKVVRVVVLDAADLSLAGMNKPDTASQGQIAHVRIELSGPPAGYRANPGYAPDLHVYHTEISRVEQ